MDSNGHHLSSRVFGSQKGDDALKAGSVILQLFRNFNQVNVDPAFTQREYMKQEISMAMKSKTGEGWRPASKCMVVRSIHNKVDFDQQAVSSKCILQMKRWMVAVVGARTE